MKDVTLLYRCSQCGRTFSRASAIPYKHAKDLLYAYIYDTTPSSPTSLKYTLNDCIEHECEMTDGVLTIGMAKLIGYVTTETPDPEQPKLHQVK